MELHPSHVTTTHPIVAIESRRRLDYGGQNDIENEKVAQPNFELQLTRCGRKKHKWG
jgi:hypothetical protein